MSRLDTYLKLERVMLDLDAVSDPTADGLRDLMDGLWYGLADRDREWLNARALRWNDGRGEIQLPLSAAFFTTPVAGVKLTPGNLIPTITQWSEQ